MNFKKVLITIPITIAIMLMAILPFLDIEKETAKAEPLYTLNSDTILLPKYNMHYFDNFIDIRQFTFDYTLTQIGSSQQYIDINTIYFDEREPSQVQQQYLRGNRLKASYNTSNGRLSLHLYNNDTVVKLLAFVTQTNGDIEGELRFYYIECYDEFTQNKLLTDIFKPFNWFWEKPQNSTLYEKTEYDTRYIPQYPDTEWTTLYTTSGIPHQVQNVYNRQTGTLTFTVPANTNTDTFVAIGTLGLRMWDIADMTVQANIRHYTDTGAIQIYYSDTELGEEQITETDFYSQPQLKTYINIENIPGNKYFQSMYFAIPPSTEPQTITLSLGQGMYMKGYLSSQRDINRETQIAYNKGYSAGIQTAEEGDWVHLMTALWDVPMAYINGIFDVTILGINLKELFKAVVLIALTAAIIKRFI